MKKPAGILYASAYLACSTAWGVVNGWLLYFYLPPSGTPLVPVALFSLVMLLSRGVNIAITLPVGYLSDRTRTRWGRRMPYIVPGALCVPILFYLLWTPPHAGQSIWNLIYLAIVMLAFNVAYEIFQTPYDSLLPELIPDEKGRISTSAWESAFQLLGAILAGFAGPLIEKAGYADMALIYAAGTAAFLLIPLAFLRERRSVIAVPVTATFRESIRLTFSNRHFVIFTASYALFWMATTFILETMPYIVTEICRLSEADTVYFYLPAVLVSLLCFPLVSWLAKRVGKERLFRTSLLGGAIVLPGLMLIGDRIPMPLIAQGISWIVLEAALLSGAQALPTAIAAEITDLDEKATGQRREGAIYAIWGLLDQLAAGVASAALPLFLLLGRSADDPRGPLGIRLLGLAGGIFLFLAYLVFRQYDRAQSQTRS